jgi:type IV pilus assembly protein PilA
MSRKPWRQKRGFTLLELMVVIVIIGIVAAVAIPAFMRFVRKSRTSEAPINIKNIVTGAVAWFNDEHSDKTGAPLAKHFPNENSPYSTVGTATTTPGVLPCVTASSAGSLYKRNAARWSVEPWKSLKFGITKAHYYRYTFASTGTDSSAKFTVTAQSDLDCDTNLSDYQQTGDVSASGEVQRSQLVINSALE